MVILVIKFQIDVHKLDKYLAKKQQNVCFKKTITLLVKCVSVHVFLKQMLLRENYDILWIDIINCAPEYKG